MNSGICITHGFTLIELLVSLSIISLLIAIAIPALQRAKERSWVAVCGSHLHQIGIGLTNFAADRFDEMPREGVQPQFRENYERHGEFLPWPEAILPYMGTGNALTSPVYQDPAHPNPNHFAHYVINGIGFKVDKYGGILEHTGNRRGVSYMAAVQRPSEIIYMTSFTDDRDNSIAANVHSWNPMEAQAVFDVWLPIHLYGPDVGSNRSATNVRRISWGRHGDTNNVLHFDMHVSRMMKDEILDLENWFDGIPRVGDDLIQP